MESLDVWCPNCDMLIQYQVETEDMGAGTEHDIKCPRCKKQVYFEIDYEPVVGNERLEF
jgi:phage FluMu protein Com